MTSTIMAAVFFTKSIFMASAISEPPLPDIISQIQRSIASRSSTLTRWPQHIQKVESPTLDAAYYVLQKYAVEARTHQGQRNAPDSQNGKYTVQGPIGFTLVNERN